MSDHGILAHVFPRYSYGKNVNGAYHSRFGLTVRRTGGKDMKEGEKEITFIRGMEKTGTVKD